MSDIVNHPSHYTDGGVETIDYIETWGLGFHLGNALKYISRAGKKNPDKKIEDLEKALWYIRRALKVNKDKRRFPITSKEAKDGNIITSFGYCLQKGITNPVLSKTVRTLTYLGDDDYAMTEASEELRKYIEELKEEEKQYESNQTVL